MSKNIKGVIPKWRFPEFMNSGQWEEKKIDTLGEPINGLNGKKSDDFGSGEPYIQYKQVFDKSYIDFSECGKVNIKDDEKQNAVQKGDVLFTTSSETPDEVGFASVVVTKPHKKTYLNSFCFILRPFDLEKTPSSFYRFLFRSSIYRKSVSAIAQGSTRYNLSKMAFLKLKIPIPPKLEEQQKIADCLSSIDELIYAEEKKLSSLNDYKKGWMQKLFPAEGKTVPEWRFPEFKDRGEWTSDLIANVISTIRPPKKLSTFEYKMIGRYPIVDQGQDEFCGWTDEKSSLVDFDNKVLIFGDHTCVVKLVDRPFAQGADGIKIISTKKKISVDFLFQYLCNSPIISNRYKRHFSELKEKTILFPDLDSGEQEKISRFLFSIDILIKKEKNKITELKQHKKALMQGLFPAVEEVL